ncbi:hypothetical protein K439DRAFT_1635360 [Ramaria rubella]|nr:hypothetical protein K439DRAFT_1635360 [Ramaria rubella]
MSSQRVEVVRKAVARKGRKGHLYRPSPISHGPTAEEQVRIIKRRVQKAERDERIDITLAITPPKTYMGGFTRPRDLRATNWFPGGPYLLKGKQYESPHESAYEPHTVFLLESRYKVRHGIGRVDSKDHVVGVCRASDFVKLIEKYNSVRCPFEARESMDNACWPWLPKSGKVLKPTRWWGPDENLEDFMKELYEDPNYSSEDVQKVASEAEEEIEEEEPTGNQKKWPAFIPLQNLTDQRAAKSKEESTTELHTPAKSEESSPLQTGAASSSTASTGMDSPRQAPPHLSRQIPSAADIRTMYEPMLSTEPFWRPVLAIIFSTRPLALSHSRLSKGLERGLPFYASISNDDRKCLFSFTNRIISLRLARMRKLAIDIVARLAGHKGGFVGIRFATHERGRGISGEGMADPIRPEKRIVQVQVGNWYGVAQQEHELYEVAAEEWGGKDAVVVSKMNEWGRKLDAEGNEVPLTEAEMTAGEVEEMDADEDSEEDVDEDEDTEEERLLLNPHLPSTGRKLRLKEPLRGDDAASAALRRKLAYRLGGNHRSITRI